MKKLRELFLHVADLMDGDWAGEGITLKEYDNLTRAYNAALGEEPCSTWYREAVKGGERTLLLDDNMVIKVMCPHCGPSTARLKDGRWCCIKCGSWEDNPNA